MVKGGPFSYRWRFIFILTLTYTTCECQIFRYTEGDNVRLKFPYTCGFTDVSLQYGHRVPFYRSSGSLNLPPDQYGRFVVEEVSENNKCSLHLHIRPLMRSDVGTFILLANDNKYITRVGLNVDLLPGEAHCGFQRKHISGPWVQLNCTAPVGSMSGQIQCFQDGIELPPLRLPSETSGNLEQTILVHQNQHHVFCCSSPASAPKEKCECDDFVWDPISKNETITPTDPCPADIPVVTAPPTHQTSKQPPSKSVATISLQTSSTEPERQKVPWYITLITSMAIFMIMMWIWIILMLVRSGRGDTSVICGNSTSESSLGDTSEKETKIDMTQFEEKDFWNKDIALPDHSVIKNNSYLAIPSNNDSDSDVDSPKLSSIREYSEDDE